MSPDVAVPLSPCPSLRATLSERVVVADGAMGSMLLRAVLFDMDGLLVDTEPLWFEVERAVMARLGGDWTDADQRALIGGSMDRTVGYLIERATRPAGSSPQVDTAGGPGGSSPQVDTVSPDQVAGWLRDGMVALLTSRDVEPMPGAVDLVGQVRAADLPYALVTSSEPIIVDAVLAALASRGVTFDVVVSGADVARPKPDPEPYLLAASKLGVDPRCCVALEDSPNGVRSAHAAGCTTVAVPGLAPITGIAGVHLVSSLADIDLDTLRGLIAAGRPGG